MMCRYDQGGKEGCCESEKKKMLSKLQPRRENENCRKEVIYRNTTLQINNYGDITE